MFDLKGSMRSRYIDPSKDSSNDVLLDENFLNRKTLLYLVDSAQQVYYTCVHVYNVNVSHTRVYIHNLYVYIRTWECLMYRYVQLIHHNSLLSLLIQGLK